MTDQALAEVIPADATTIMDVIARAAQDPNTDVEKLAGLLSLYERITGRQSEQVYNEAMNAAQEEMKPIAADASNPQTRSKYASYPALDRELRPIYVKHGFSLSFDTADPPAADMVRVVCRVAHKGGFSREHRVDMPADGKGAKGGDVMTKTHATGSALSYSQRYLLKLIFNIAVTTDDDGNGASLQPITEEQVRQLAMLAQSVEADMPKFLAYMKVDDLTHLPAAKFKAAKAALEKKRAKP